MFESSNIYLKSSGGQTFVWISPPFIVVYRRSGFIYANAEKIIRPSTNFTAGCIFVLFNGGQLLCFLGETATTPRYSIIVLFSKHPVSVSLKRLWGLTRWIARSMAIFSEDRTQWTQILWYIRQERRWGNTDLLCALNGLRPRNIKYDFRAPSSSKRRQRDAGEWRKYVDTLIQRWDKKKRKLILW